MRHDAWRLSKQSADDWAEENNTETDKGKEKSPKKADSDSNEDKEYLSYLVLL